MSKITVGSQEPIGVQSASLQFSQTYGAEACGDSNHNESLIAKLCGNRRQQRCQGRYAEESKQDPLGTEPLGHQTTRDLRQQVAVEERTENVTLNFFRPRKRPILHKHKRIFGCRHRNVASHIFERGGKGILFWGGNADKEQFWGSCIRYYMHIV